MAKPQSKNTDSIKLSLKTVPESPGIYKFFDAFDRIIYVGKAKNLKKRVSTYFTREKHDNNKVRIMVSKVARLEHFVVDTEVDALLLENNLIKKYQPRYNAMLKDDKTFPWICIKNEPMPRIFTTRNVVRDGSRYFGPFASNRMLGALMELIRQLFQYRTCRLNLSDKNIASGKYKVCLEYHVGNCAGPCQSFQSAEDYAETINQVEEIIKGNLSRVRAKLKELMLEHSAKLEFEKANLIKERISLLENYQSRSTVVSVLLTNVDVCSVVSDEDFGYVNFLKVVDGAVVHSFTLELRKKLDESDEQLLELAMVELRQKFQSNAPEVIVPKKIVGSIPDVKFTVPKRGDKLKLLELSQRNAKYYRLEKMKQNELVDPERHTRRILQKIKDDFKLPELPVYMECFDNSNTMGSQPVAAMVVFRNARPSKKEYRNYNIRTVEGPDDYASMQEVVTRRYKRLLDEGTPLPNLVVVDGGKGQLSSAFEALQNLGLRGRVPIVGIAKRLEEIYFPGDSIPVYIDKKSETLKVIQAMRDEAHRFGITHHRQRRQKESLKSQLPEIKGIGPQTEILLLEKFKSLARLKKATLQEIEAVVGISKAKILKENLI